MAAQQQKEPGNSGKRISFINPPVVCASPRQIPWYSYAHPTSILKLSRYLKTYGHRVSLIDCMNYVKDEPPQLEFYKQMPVGAAHLGASRPTYIMGRSFQWLKRRLRQVQYPDEIWLSCHITFNNELAHRTIRMAHDQFPKADIIFGGNYPTLFPDEVGKSGATPHVGPFPDAATCFPDYTIFRRDTPYMVFQLALGCENRCAHCLNHKLSIIPTRLDDEEVVSFIEQSHKAYGIRSFVNIDPNPAVYNLKRFLDLIAAKNLDVFLSF